MTHRSSSLSRPNQRVSAWLSRVSGKTNWRGHYASHCAKPHTVHWLSLSNASYCASHCALTLTVQWLSRSTISYCALTLPVALCIRLISQFEWGNKHLAADQTKSEEQIRKLIVQKADNLCEEIGCGSLVTKIEREALQYNRTVIAAQKAGFETMHIGFGDIDGDACTTATKVLDFAKCKQIQPCVTRTVHKGANLRKRDLVWRVGNTTAGKITQTFEGTKYAWMLNLRAEQPPDGF